MVAALAVVAVVAALAGVAVVAALAAVAVVVLNTSTPAVEAAEEARHSRPGAGYNSALRPAEGKGLVPEAPAEVDQHIQAAAAVDTC